MLGAGLYKAEGYRQVPCGRQKHVQMAGAREMCMCVRCWLLQYKHALPLCKGAAQRGTEHTPQAPFAARHRNCCWDSTLDPDPVWVPPHRTRDKRCGYEASFPLPHMLRLEHRGLCSPYLLGEGIGGHGGLDRPPHDAAILPLLSALNGTTHAFRRACKADAERGRPAAETLPRQLLHPAR